VAKELAEKAEKEKVDLVLLCGDIQNEDSIENILQPFKDRNQKMLIISGNHESISTAEFLSKINHAKHLHGYSVRYEEIGIFGCGSANIGIHGLSETEIFNTLKKGFDKISYLPKKIMMTHVHPSKSKMEKLSNFVKGSQGVLQALRELRPDILLCSHVHEAEGLEEELEGTRVINVGSKGKIIDL
ncbi:metallophosphoesterase family protein, partial [Candidatus Woesearchaeota archaeon]|nr:metallophosphoesterase family protein [Candidatus Woesearchaeota archaeon]